MSFLRYQHPTMATTTTTHQVFCCFVAPFGGSMTTMYPALLGILLLPAVLCREFKVAFLYNGVISDFGWSYTHNEGRIRAHDELRPYMVDRGDSLRTEIFENVEPGNALDLMGQISADGYDMVFSTSFTYHDQTFAAARSHPNMDFVHMTGYHSGLDNFATAHGRVYHSKYVSGVVAGGETKTNRVSYISSLPIAEVYRSANAFYLGAQVGAGAIVNSTYVEHKVDVVVMWIGTFYDPVKEREAARRMHLLGCDVIAYHTNTQEGSKYAKEVNITSVAANTDGRKFIGESVLTSSNFNWGPIYKEMINRSYTGNFRDGNHGIWYGYPSGVSVNYDPSFRVSSDTRSLFEESVEKLKGGWDPFCYPIWNDEGKFVQQELNATCIDDYYLQVNMTYLVEGITDVGQLSHFGDACPSGTRYVEDINQTIPSYRIECHPCLAGMYSNVTDIVEGVKECSKCPAGTYSAEDGAAECTECAQDTFSEEGASSCTPCPSGYTNSGFGNVHCPLEDESSNILIAIIVSAIVGGVLVIAVPLVCTRVLRDRSKITELHSETAVAMRCATSIARMQLEDLKDIRDIQNPSEIVSSFIQIIDNLAEYKRYLPRSLLAKHCESLEDSGNFPPDRFAPGLDTQFAAVVFTDIQRSTELWESFANDMQTALNIHNTLARKAIVKNNGYEVKTIGDAFMVTFDTDHQALRFALDFQFALLQSELWPPNLHTHPASRQIGSYWKGLRVRIGIHSGPVSTETNTLTGRVDYFGSTVNKAARLEAAGVGGSVCVAGGVLEKLQEDRDQYKELVIVELPNTTLKGFSGTHDLSILLPRTLEGRREDVLMHLHERQIARPQARQQLAGSPGKNPFCDTTTVRSFGDRGTSNSFSVVASATVCCMDMSFVDAFEGETAEMLSGAFNSVLVHLERTKGNVIAAHNTSLIVGWNTVPTQNVGSHMLLASRFVELSQEHFLKHGYSAAMGICAGSVVCGMVGTGSQKFMTVVGTPINIAHSLVLEAEHFKCFACVASYSQKLSLLTDHMMQGVIRPVSRLHISSSLSEQLTVYQMDFLKGDEQDWLWGEEYTVAFTESNYKLISAHLHVEGDRTMGLVCEFLEEHTGGSRERVKPTIQ